MKYENLVLNKLLDKYEQSAHFKENVVANRRILLKCDEKTLNIDYSVGAVQQDFLACVQMLQEQKLVQIVSWTRAQYIIDKLSLVIENVDSAYKYLNRPQKRTQLNIVIDALKACISTVQKEWLLRFLCNAFENISRQERLMGIWKNEFIIVQNLLKALCKIDQIGANAISMRAFSVWLYADSKYFEKQIKRLLIPIIKNNEPAIFGVEEIEDREVLAQVGIIMMPEIFEFCGNICIRFQEGDVDFSPIKKGACISGDCIDDIREIQYFNIDKIIFIENKTNYSEYNLTCKSEDSLIIYHGGFYSPVKEKFFKKISQYAQNIPMFFWGDIDFGGFNMYERLKRNVISNLNSLNMDVNAYRKYLDFGVEKSDDYLNKVERLLDYEQFSEFSDVIKLILQNHKIVEQENFLRTV